MRALMKAKYCVALILCLCVFRLSTLDSHAEEIKKNTDPEWEQDLATLKTLSSRTPEGCHDIFKILWKWSKRDNLEARAALLIQMTMMHGPFMRLPAFLYDEFSRIRSTEILAMHTIYEDMDDKSFNYVRGMYLISDIGIKAGDKLDTCFQKTRSQECIKEAYKSDTITPLDLFEKEIDLFIDAGAEAKCAGIDHH